MMGRERNWSSSSSNSGGGRSTKRSKDRAAATETPPPAAATAAAAGCMSGVFHLFDFHQFQFSLNHQLCFKPNSSFIQEQEQQPPIVHTTIKGAEAPRNSLESEEDISVTGTDKTVSSSSEIKEEDFGFPIGIRVHTKVSRELSSSESCVSPCIKTPSLVARLMGLDLLPETVLSPSSSSSSSSSSSIHSRLNKSTTPDHYHHGFESRKPLKTRHSNFMENEIRYDMSGTRSLPDTPRISSARRSDVDPRLSLQINKENQVMINEEFDYGRNSTDSNKSRKREWRLEEERSSQSPSHYARQIVKQVKESVSRRVGRDITNVVSSNISSNNYNKKNSNRSRNNYIEEEEEEEEEEEAQLLKPKKSSRFNKIAEDLSPSKHSMQSCSPRLRFLETKNKPALPTSQEQIPNSPKPLSKPRQVLPSRSPPPPPPPPPPPQPSNPKASVKPKSQNIPQHQTIDKCKKASCERFAQRKDTGIIRASPASKANLNLQVDRKCKKSPLSKELSPCSISTPTSVYYSHHHQLLSSSPASKPSSQLYCPSSQTTRYEHTPDLDVHNCIITTTGTNVEEFRYLSRILKCTGLDTDTQMSFTRWYSPSHPLDPSIFHHLENSFSLSAHTTTSGHLTHRPNRKLLFNLVDEILVDILRPYLDMKPWINSIKRKKKKKSKQMTGDQLLQDLWTEICNFPSANCQILQDIDALIDKDLPDANIRMLPIFEEVESITFEIEQDILDSLVHELAVTAVFP